MHDHATAEALTDHVYCQNCGKPLLLHAHFCSHCGQKPITGKITIHELLHQFLHIWLHIEGKLIATLRHLFIPGKLTQDFFKGLHVRYAHPVQLFFILGVLCFEMVECATHKQEEELKEKLSIRQKRNQWNLFTDKMDSVALETKKKFPVPSQVSHALDTLTDDVKKIPIYSQGVKFAMKDTIDSIMRVNAKENINTYSGTPEKKTISNKSQAPPGIILAKKDSLYNDFKYINLNIDDNEANKDDSTTINFGSSKTRIRNSDFWNLTEEELIDKYKIRNYWQKLILKQGHKITKEGGSWFTLFLSKSFWGVVFIIPFISLLFLFFYRKKRFYLVEHLVFWMHYHAFLFLSVILAIFLKVFLNGQIFSVLATLILLYIPVYLFIAMKRYYGDSYLKTVLKYLITGIAYQTLFIFAIFGVMFVSFLIF